VLPNGTLCGVRHQWRLRGMSTLRHLASLDSNVPFALERGTKIVCTTGPASEGRLTEMLLAGMNVVCWMLVPVIDRLCDLHT